MWKVYTRGHTKGNEHKGGPEQAHETTQENIQILNVIYAWLQNWG